MYYLRWGLPESKELSYIAMLVYSGKLFLMRMAPAIECLFPGRRDRAFF
jgi:hypothetical protein